MAIVKQILQTQKQWSFMKKSCKIKLLAAMKNRPWSCRMMLFHALSMVVSVQNFCYNCHMKMSLTCMNFLINFHWLWLCTLFEHLLQIDFLWHDFILMHDHWLWVCQIFIAIIIWKCFQLAWIFSWMFTDVYYVNFINTCYK